MSGLHEFRYFPLIHCPSLCPYNPPPELFADDYDPSRERACRRVCFGHCGLTSEQDRPCLAEFERRRFTAAVRKPETSGCRRVRPEQRRPWG
jgi:hypothetical protein